MPSDDQQVTLGTFDADSNGSDTASDSEDTTNVDAPINNPVDESTTASVQCQSVHSSTEFETGAPIADEYLATVSGADIRESTARQYETDLRSYTRYLDRQDIVVLEAEIADIKGYLRQMARNNLATETLKSRQTSITGLYKYIRRESDRTARIDLLLLQDIDANGFQTRDRVQKRPLSEEELTQLFDAMQNRRDRLIVLVASETGARNRDLRNIEISDIDFEQNIIHVPNTKSNRTYSIPISDEVALELERWIEIERDESYNCPDSQYLFPSKRNEKLMGGGRLNKIITSAAERAGIQEVVAEREPTRAERNMGVTKDKIQLHRVTPHLLRHTFSHLLKEAGLHSDARSAALDHDNIETTEEYYTYTKSEYRHLMRQFFHGQTPL